MNIVNGHVFDVEQGFVSKTLATHGGIIAQESTDDVVIDAEGCYVIPALTDLHFHGCMGHDFSDGDSAGLVEMARYQLQNGVGQICPAGMTLLEDQLSKICTMAADHVNMPDSATLVGLQLEGPFLSRAKKGAQNGDWLHGLDLAMLKRLQQAANGLIKLVAMAPELDGAMEFIREASKDVVISVAHTGADYETATSAFEAGARQVTHLYNAMPAYTHRAPGVVGAAMDAPDVMVELICDGVHIHPSVVRGTFRMFGAERVILISDSMRATGMPDGQYTLGGQDVVVKGRLATLLDGTIAGSATNLMHCMQTAITMGIAPQDAVNAAAVNPAKALGIYDRVGSLDVGKEANFVILNPDFTLKQVVFHGNIVE
ncbi:N-acetylglucosamine-6-phosphate deacetylase [Bengtsoniella intestinalis]|uniref:N-acetylglucosamine-6-phosphate deacetylase n=1 Tax=Bengtsoniella intestinalis TaxID=3073143 RepID=UPI00391EFE57